MVYRGTVERNDEPAWPDRAALFLDLDGTLIEFAERPDKVEPSAELRQLLMRLERIEGGAVAIVSGRPLRELDRLLAPYQFAAAGVHGNERRDWQGRVTGSPVTAGVLESVYGRLQSFAAKRPGLLVENKTISLALHYRQRPDLADDVTRLADELGDLLPAGYELLRGHMVIEIKPADADKGSAIRAFMREPPFSGRTPVFIGDDVTDEAGFSAVNALGGISIKVSDGDSAANWRLPDVSAVLDWLDRSLPE